MSKLFSRSLSALAMLRKDGIGEVVSRLRFGAKADVVEKYGSLMLDPTPPKMAGADVPRNTVNWVTGPFAAGSGGHINSFRFVAMLAERGYACRVVVDAGPWFGTNDEVGKRFRQIYGAMDVEVHVGVQSAPPSYVAVATGWNTAYSVRNQMTARERFYFVQDFEPWFEAHGAVYQFAEDTYRFGFVGVTAGGWLATKLRAEYGMPCHAVGFSYEDDLYKLGPKPTHPGFRVFFYARPSTERRAFEMGLLALARLCAKVPAVTVVLAGADLSRFVIPFAHESLGSVNVKNLPAVYQSCDLALVISMTNLSLLPLELMACGVPVVSNDGPTTEWLLNRDNVALAPANVVALADAMQALLADSVRREELAAAGTAFARSTSWQREGDALAAALATRGCVPIDRKLTPPS